MSAKERHDAFVKAGGDGKSVGVELINAVTKVMQVANAEHASQPAPHHIEDKLEMVDQAPQGVAEVMQLVDDFGSACEYGGYMLKSLNWHRATLEQAIAAIVQELDALRAEKSGPYFGHYQQSLTKIARLDARVAELERDAARLDWLEAQINKHGAIHLHDGNNAYGLGLGLRPGPMVRTLRYAIDDAKGPSHG